MVIEERSLSSTAYRFGFNGQEKDDEVSGEGNSMTAEFWQYDSRLGRRWNVDPLQSLNASNYSGFDNNPITNIDPIGNTDYYAQDGTWIGTDGVANDVVRIVTSNDLRKCIIRKSKKGISVKADAPNQDFYELPSKEVVVATIDVFDEQQLNRDKGRRAGSYETATYFNNDGDQSPILVGEDCVGREDGDIELVVQLTLMTNIIFSL